MTKLQVNDHVKITSFMGSTFERITKVDQRWAWIKNRRFVLCTLSDGSLVPMDDDSKGTIKYHLASVKAEKVRSTKKELVHKIVQVLQESDFSTHFLAEILTTLNLKKF